MGLFDTVKCEYPLPVAAHQGLEFQTKDLERALGSYTITRDGRLVRHPWRGVGPGLDRDVEWPLHGDVTIYTSLGLPAGDRVWVEYVVRFTHGRVEWIRPGAEVAPPPARDEDAPAIDSTPAETAPPLGPEEALLQSLRRDRAELEKLLAASDDHWGYEDPVYRFYHQSFKLYGLQQRTEAIVERLQALAPERPLDRWFMEIVQSGTGKEFRQEDNARWTAVTRPILEAFFHARFFLEMAVRYADLAEPPQPLPSGYAALLHLFGLR